VGRDCVVWVSIFGCSLEIKGFIRVRCTLLIFIVFLVMIGSIIGCPALSYYYLY